MAKISEKHRKRKASLKRKTHRRKKSPSKKASGKSPYHKLFESFGALFTLNGSTSEAVADECPFCFKEKHCYLNVETGLFDCKHCGESGNALDFIRHEYWEALDATTDADYKTLKKKRGLPLQTFKRHGLAFHRESGSWIIPFMSPKGEPINLVRYRPPSGTSQGRMLNLPGLPTCLYGVDQLSDDSDHKLYICEGPWDAIALDQHLRKKKNRDRYDIVAVPGANTFKEAWAEFCRDRSVRLVYDNDPAGRKGQERAAKLIHKTAAEVYKLQWPDGLKKGFDISDLIREGVNVAEFTNEHCEKVTAGRQKISFVRGDKVKKSIVRWLWEGHIQFTTFVSFSGLHGTQKSCIARDLVGRATAGEPMPNCEEGLEPFEVLYFTSEDEPSQIQDLVEIAGGDLTRLHIHDISESLEPIDILDRLEEIEAEILSRKVRLVVFDALNSFTGGEIGTDSRARHTLSGPLQSLARRTGACIIGIRNWGRMVGGTSSQKSLGAVSLSDVARCVLNTRELDPIEKGSPRRFLLEFEKVTNAKEPNPIPYEVEDLSTPEASYLRRIVWKKPIDVEELRKAIDKSKKKEETSKKRAKKKVAKKGSSNVQTHLVGKSNRKRKKNS